MLGLKRGTVQLLPHEAQWEEQGRQVVSLLREVLGDSFSRIFEVILVDRGTEFTDPSSIEIDQESTSFEQLRTRIQTFAEVL